ncbi:hypothetical protein F511_46472 [Dorcoceras hygrometricum]|uniref:Uncharacterized protein n=1 Tax=Dorcoceras hygrometricum TaxID=472368 RepID=A0A2Z7A0C2_9LAMI|nr:hypothetical protein F511_46472 [Dorcoceras hygrometricum]
MMTSAYLLEEAIRIKDDVNSKLQYIQQSTRSARAGSAMMKSAVTYDSILPSRLDSADALCIDNQQSQDTSRKVPVAEYTSRKMLNQSQATVHPVAGYSVLHIQSQEIQTQEKQT